MKLLGFDHAWAERFRRAIAGGRAAGRDVMERAIREAGARHRWTTEQSNALVALLIQHVGYLHLRGHALAMAQHVFRQACLKVNPATAPLFFVSPARPDERIAPPGAPSPAAWGRRNRCGQGAVEGARDAYALRVGASVRLISIGGSRERAG